ncbi:uncharacterized protein B0P05DRAFT_553036 [Gilbertella persicaria]|uniref:uncharacterized protein n=1 Tax=Gilbertella persicaria TaxID=101096 RepID=UPI00221F4F3E|nr:uncharacterized protein B0P05DRAFT_553036 [Gilbertella persicaria]KAI8066967.1 hypothetical protein B0P05DRAFT_553036 [Gilbertella persicaria]
MNCLEQRKHYTLIDLELNKSSPTERTNTLKRSFSFQIVYKTHLYPNNHANMVLFAVI